MFAPGGLFFYAKRAGLFRADSTRSAVVAEIIRGRKVAEVTFRLRIAVMPIGQNSQVPGAAQLVIREFCERDIKCFHLLNKLGDLVPAGIVFCYIGCCKMN